MLVQESSLKSGNCEDGSEHEVHVGHEAMYSQHDQQPDSSEDAAPGKQDGQQNPCNMVWI